MSVIQWAITAMVGLEARDGLEFDQYWVEPRVAITQDMRGSQEDMEGIFGVVTGFIPSRPLTTVF